MPCNRPPPVRRRRSWGWTGHTADWEQCERPPRPRPPAAACRPQARLPNRPAPVCATAHAAGGGAFPVPGRLLRHIQPRETLKSWLGRQAAPFPLRLLAAVPAADAGAVRSFQPPVPADGPGAGTPDANAAPAPVRLHSGRPPLPAPRTQAAAQLTHAVPQAPDGHAGGQPRLPARPYPAAMTACRF